MWVPVAAILALLQAAAAAGGVNYHIEPARDLSRFTASQIGLLEKLNRADAEHLTRLPALIVPDLWTDELAYSPLPRSIPWAQPFGKSFVVHLPSQVFGAYEYGALIRWGPVSSGRASHPTPSGLFHLNWHALRRTSTDNEAWKLEWYFNFHNGRGLALHEFSLPGKPASHACLRLLRRDAMWLYGWGEGWVLADDGQNMARFGTPVLVVGAYDFQAPPPWSDPTWWRTRIIISDEEWISLSSRHPSARNAGVD